MKTAEAVTRDPAKAHKLVAYILTLNEAHHIHEVICSLRRVTQALVVVDSYSNDGTPTKAKEAGAEVWQHPFESWASQHNWALDRIQETYAPEWVFSLDADERMSDALEGEIREVLTRSTPRGHDIYLVPLRIAFSGRILRFGGSAGTKLPRFHRVAAGRYESRVVNEHLVPAAGARIGSFRGPILHEDVDSWERYIEKHNDYSTREALARLNLAVGRAEPTSITAAIRKPFLRRRWMREHLLNPLPAKGFLRFVQIYLLLGGFLDGSAGFNRALFQAWQEMCTDLKYQELLARHAVEQSAVSDPAPPESTTRDP